MINIKGIKRGRGSLESYIRNIYRSNQDEIDRAFSRIDIELTKGGIPTSSDSYETRFLKRIGNQSSVRNIKSRIAEMNTSKFVLGSKERVAANNLFNDMKANKDLWNTFRGLTRNSATGRFSAVDLNNLTFQESGSDINGTYAIYQYNNGDHITYIKIYQSPNSSGNNINVSNNLKDL